MRRTLYVLISSLALLALDKPAAAQSDVDQQLGSVHFQTSCNEVAQRRFDRAMRYQHSYWYLPAKEVFEEVLKADPSCAMAYWGVALTLLDNPHNAIPQSNLGPGLEAIQKAKAMNAKTERERDYIDALMLMYADYHFARALGAARSGKPDAAKLEVAKLAELSDKLRQGKDAYWAEIVDIQRQVAAAWVLHAEGKSDEALKAMSAAADAEDKTEKHALTPGPLAPARELYGSMLLDRGMPKEALVAFEATIKKEPNRFNAIAGAARASELLGDRAKAKDYYKNLVTLGSEADTIRPDLAAARKFANTN